MKLEQLLLNVELQGDILIKMYDYDLEAYGAEIPYTRDQLGRLLDWFGEYYVKFIYPENGATVIEISAE